MFSKKFFPLIVALILFATQTVFAQNEKPLPNEYLFDNASGLVPYEPAVTNYDTVAKFLTAAVQKMVGQPWPDAQNARARPIPEDTVKFDSIIFTRSINGSYYQLFFGQDVEIYWQPGVAVCILFVDGVKAVFNLNSADEWEPDHGPHQPVISIKKLAVATTVLETLPAQDLCWAVFWKDLSSGYIGHGHAVFNKEEATKIADSFNARRTPMNPSVMPHWAGPLPCPPAKKPKE